ncbi:hypothetical protein T01_292 [Trichinella spiralis]|uniref:Uncharacterized protein n=1 Tax=Trichinella spiralis TaxID=6334 RepID=A0A0V1AP78_TRISP|nr:hypothetical protein T01_292 [Trichinella spiralis]
MLSAIKLAIVVDIEWPAARLIARADGVQAITAADFIILLFSEFGASVLHKRFKTSASSLQVATCAVEAFSKIRIQTTDVNFILMNFAYLIILVPAFCTINISMYFGINIDSIQIVSFEFCRNEIYKNKDTKTGEQQQDGAVRDKGLWEGGASKINTVLRHRSRSRRLLDPPTYAIASLDKSVSLDCND